MSNMSSARVWAAAAAAVGVSLLAVPGVASADPLPAGCTQADAAGPVTCVYTSGSNELLLPEGVTSVTVTAVGGHGGSFGDYDNEIVAGGRGAEVTGTVAIPSGTRTLYAVVGGDGDSATPGTGQTGGAGGANGGGDGGTPVTDEDVYPGAGGGGASDIRTASGDLNSRLVVAAGGGGARYSEPGGDAGAPGRQFGQLPAAQPGTDTEGGSGGIASDDTAYSGADGTLGVGGHGGRSVRFDANVAGGGGGGGLYGGGGGSVIGSGAGGSSLAPAGTTVSLPVAAPSVTITYQPPTVTPEPPVCSGSSCLPDGLFGSS